MNPTIKMYGVKHNLLLLGKMIAANSLAHAEELTL